MNLGAHDLAPASAPLRASFVAGNGGVGTWNQKLLHRSSKVCFRA